MNKPVVASLPKLERILLQCMKEHPSWPDMPITCLLAYSGGLDSSVLLLAMSKLFHAGLIQDRVAAIKACHFDHGWRDESAEADEAHCRSFCLERNIPYCSASWAEIRATVLGQDLPDSALGETAARRYRYAWFDLLQAEEERQSKIPTYVLLAQHADDQAETVLLNLFRGSGLVGLAAMPLRRGHYLRPLLSVGKAELEAYAQEMALPYLQDPSNFAAITPRNRLRHELLPLAESIFDAKIRQRLASCAEQLQYVYQDAEQRLDQFCADGKLCFLREPFDVVVLHKADLLEMPKFLRALLYRRVVEKLCHAADNLGSEHYERWEKALFAEKESMFISYAGLRVVYDRYALRIWKRWPLEIERSTLLFWPYTGEDKKILPLVLAGRDLDEQLLLSPYSLRLAFFHASRENPASCEEEEGLLFEYQNHMRYNYRMRLSPSASATQAVWRRSRVGDQILLKDGRHKKLRKLAAERLLPFELRPQLLVLADERQVLSLPWHDGREAETAHPPAHAADELIYSLTLTACTD